MNNTAATIEELKATLDAWIPKYIRQVVELRSGSKLSAERYNELMNLLITQGDDTIELAQIVKQYVELLVDDVTTDFDEKTAAMTQVARNATVTANNAVISVAEYKTKINADFHTLEEQTNLLTTNAIDAAESAISTTSQLVQDMESYRVDLTSQIEQTFRNIRDSLSAQVDLEVAEQVEEVSTTLSEAINQSFATLTDAVTAVANEAKQIANGAVTDVEEYKADMDARLDDALKEVEESLSVAGDVIRDAAQLYAKLNAVDVILEEIGKSTARNLVPFPYYEKAGTENGITWTVNDDGTIGVSGTATAQVSFTIKATSQNWVLPKGTYTLSGCPSGGGFSTYRLQLARFVNNTLTSYGNDYGSNTTFEITEDLPLLMQFVVASGVTLDATIKPMLEYGSVAHEFVPYYFGTAETAKTAENADKLDGYDSSAFLKLNENGGTVSFTDYAAVKVKRNHDSHAAGVCITFANNTGTIGMIGFKNKKLIRVDSANNWAEYEVLDASNVEQYASKAEEGTFTLKQWGGMEIPEFSYIKIGKMVVLYGAVKNETTDITTFASGTDFTGLPYPIASLRLDCVFSINASIQENPIPCVSENVRSLRANYFSLAKEIVWNPGAYLSLFAIYFTS